MGQMWRFRRLMMRLVWSGSRWKRSAVRVYFSIVEMGFCHLDRRRWCVMVSCKVSADVESEIFCNCDV